MSKKYEIRVDTNDATANVSKLGNSLDKTGKSFDNASNSAEGFAKSTDNIQKVSAGMQGSIQAVSGAMNLLGKDSEAVTEVMGKFSSVMASTNGLKAVGEGVKSLGNSMKDTAKQGKLLNNVFKASAIGLFIAAVGYLINNFDDLRERFHWIDVAATKTEEVFKGLKGVFSNIIPVLKNLGKTIGTALISPIRTIVDGYQGIGKLLSAVFNGDFKNIPNIAKEVAADIKDNFTDVGYAAKELGKTVVASYNEGLNSKGDKGSESFSDKVKKDLETLQNRLKQLQDSYKNYGKSEFELLQQQLEAEMNTINNALEKELIKSEEAAVLSEQIWDRFRNSIKDGIKGLDDGNRLDAIQMSLKGYIDAVKEADGLTYKLGQDSIKTINNVQKFNKWLEGEGEKVRNYVDVVGMMGDSFNNLFGSIADNLDENSEEYRAIMITQAILSTLGGIAGAISSAFSPANSEMTIIGQAIAAAVNSAAVLASGIAAISQMKNANENTTPSVPAISTSAVSGLSKPVTSSNLVRGYSEEDLESKVYVVESDITRFQNKKRNLKTNVRF